MKLRSWRHNCRQKEDMEIIQMSNLALELSDHIQLQDMALVFHNYGDAGCPGLIVSEPYADDDSGVVLRCTECGAEVGLLDGGLYEQFMELLAMIPVRVQS